MISEAWWRRKTRNWWLCLLNWSAVRSLIRHYQSAHAIFERLLGHCNGSGDFELERGDFAQTVVIEEVVVFASMVEWMG